MSKYGLKIKNMEAACIYQYRYGFADRLETTNAMLTNSLFLDFLYTLPDFSVYKEESTRDVICVAFGFKNKGYSEKREDIRRRLSNATNEKVIESLNRELQATDNNKEYCVEISRNDLRIKYYTEGFEITYKTYKKNGEEIVSKRQTIKYKMLYRTPGKAKKGTCMFINEKLYDRAHEFLYMGIELPEHNSPIVEIGAYSSLITSSIIGRVQIRPEQMLIVKDVPTVMRTNAILVKTNENKECVTERVADYDLTGEAFDGQALLDYELFPNELDNGEIADGYVLLRHHMTKCAAFCTNIVQFMKDQFGEAYETAYVKDMWGNDVKVSEIRFITTNNAIKWLKFGKSFEYWAEWVKKNDCMFGIVKTSHKSKLGDVQRMSYQMTNSLDIDTMENVVSKSVQYIENLKSNDESYFLDYLKKNSNFSNDYEVLLALVEHNPEFVRSTYYRSRKKAIINAYTLDFKGGRILQNADNLTIVGSPYAMLLHSIGKDPRQDPTFELENDSIQCWCSKFKADEHMAEFRSPFNSRNNLGYIHNHYHEYFDKYFKLGRLCLAVNTMDTDWQPRNNGADQDSDSCYTTNQPDVVNHARYCYEHYPTVVNEIKPEKNIYDLDLKNYAIIDNTLTACQQAIGQSSNLAQIALTYTYNFEDEKYENDACILAVLAQVAIDNAKRKFDIDLPQEIRRIKKDLNISDKNGPINGLPEFWLITKQDKRKASSDEVRKQRQIETKKKIKKNLNKDLKCPMNYLYKINIKYNRSEDTTLPMDEFFIYHEPDEHHRKSRKVEEMIERYSLDLHDFYMNHQDVNWEDDEDEELLLRYDFDKLVHDIQQTYISRNYLGLMSWLINRAFKIGSGAKSKKDTMNSKADKNKSILMKVLYTVNKDAFLACFKGKKKKSGERLIFDMRKALVNTAKLNSSLKLIAERENT